jgi:hypothetical protein
MIGKSKLGAIAVVAAIGVASPAFAQGINPTYNPAYTGGGSPGYNYRATTPNWRLGHHHVIHHTPKHHVSGATKPQ